MYDKEKINENKILVKLYFYCKTIVVDIKDDEVCDAGTKQQFRKRQPDGFRKETTHLILIISFFCNNSMDN